jgi:hypothetical protein
MGTSAGGSAKTILEGVIVQGNPIDCLAHAAARAKLFQIACGVMNDGGNSEDSSSMAVSRQKIYGEVFLYLRQCALDAAEHAPEAETRAAACKAAFHLDPRTAEKPTDIASDTLGVLEQLVATLSDSGRHIRNQFISVPGLFDEEITPELFDRRWCRAHIAVLLVFAACSGAFYGGMHAFKWNDHFPSEVEKRLWRISTCISVTGVVPLTALAVAKWAKLHPLATVLCWSLFAASGFVFLVVRTFLIIESFLSVRDLPLQAYKTVQWAESIPHI